MPLFGSFSAKKKPKKARFFCIPLLLFFLFVPLRRRKMKTNLILGLGTLAACERVEFLWNESRDVNGTNSGEDVNEPKVAIQTTEKPHRRLG